MPPRKPPFAEKRKWIWRASNAKQNGYRVYFDPADRYEYARDPNPEKGTWHQINAREGLYRDIDPESGLPVEGKWGEWRKLK